MVTALFIKIPQFHFAIAGRGHSLAGFVVERPCWPVPERGCQPFLWSYRLHVADLRVLDDAARRLDGHSGLGQVGL